MKIFWTKEVVGLDIGQAVTKAVLLRFNGRSAVPAGSRVLDCRREGILNEQELSRELRPWLEQEGWHNREITVNVPQYIATTQVSDFSTASERSLEEMVAFETQQLAGLSEENFLYDYQSMPPAFGRARPVLIAICRESVIRERAELLAGANLRVADFAVSSTALAAAYLHLYSGSRTDEELHLLLDIGAESSTVAMVGNGNLLYSSTLLCGTDRYGQILARELGLSDAEAERRKTTLPVDADSAPAAVRAATVFEAELRSVISQWQAEEQTTAGQCPLTKICVCGGGARINGLAAFLGRKFDCQGEVIGVPSENGENDPGLLIAYGLALQGSGLSPLSLSLAPASVRNRAHRRRRFPFLAAGAALLAGLVVLVGVLDYRHLGERRRQLEQVKQALKASEAMLPEMDEMVDQSRLLERLLLPYVNRGRNLSALRHLIDKLGMARTRVAAEWEVDRFADVWVIYLADEQTFHAGKQEPGRDRDRERRPRDSQRGSSSPFISLTDMSVSAPADGSPAAATVKDIVPWRGFVAAVYTFSSRDVRYEQVRELIDYLNQQEQLSEVDLMPGPETVGREDIFLPWLQLTAREVPEYRRFLIQIPVDKKTLRWGRPDEEMEQ